MQKKKAPGGAFFFCSRYAVGLLVGQGLVGLSHFLEDASVLLGSDGPDHQQHDKDTQRNEIRDLCAFLFHYEIYLLMIYGAPILACF